MSWSAISTTQVLEEFTPDEADILAGIQGATTNLAAILARTVREMDAAGRAGGYATPQDGTAPDLGYPHALALARWRWLTSLPALSQLQTEARKAAAEKAEEFIKLVSNGKQNLDPLNTAPASPGAFRTSSAPLKGRMGI